MHFERLSDEIQNGDSVVIEAMATMIYRIARNENIVDILTQKTDAKKNRKSIPIIKVNFDIVIERVVSSVTCPEFFPSILKSFKWNEVQKKINKM